MEVNMKEFMELNRMMVLALLSGALITATVQAQNDQPKTDEPGAASLPISARAESATFNIDFPGGTPDALVQEVAKQSGTRPNVIIPEHVDKIVLPRFKLQNVSTAQVFEALNLIFDEKGMQHFRWISEGGKGGQRTVWILTKTPLRPPSEACQVWFIGHLLESYPLDDINTAIRATWEMSGQTSTPALKFHKETKLLIVRGSEQELKLVQEVLKALELGTATRKAGDVKKAL